ncbi:MAG: hypothetical protein CM1200mP10_11570 [Candidatus Neomarinimicrobiota bacterium]|nr:MAG: hypothetical protein CM1200mP10_11570 [Candidatus Neomarinimicrobiota bacterium]
MGKNQVNSKTWIPDCCSINYDEIETINWFTLFDEHGVSAREYFSTLTDFIFSGLLKK